jgi:hypothetical protein
LFQFSNLLKLPVIKIEPAFIHGDMDCPCHFIFAKPYHLADVCINRFLPLAFPFVVKQIMKVWLRWAMYFFAGQR